VDRNVAVVTEQIFGKFQHRPSLLEWRLWNNCQWSFRADVTYLRIAEKLLSEKAAFDLVLVYMGGTDVAGHRFWRYMRPKLFKHKPTPEQIEDFGHVIRDYYIYMDQAVGQLLAACGPNATVFILSDHGMVADNRNAQFDPDRPPADVNSGAHRNAEPGFFVAAGPGIRKPASGESARPTRREELNRIGSVLDITPIVLALFGIPVGKDMDGRVLTHVLSDEVTAGGLAEPIATHDDDAFFASRPEAAPHKRSQEERLRQLRSLGYIKNEAE
jgi:arylsulfatase A-like enzyme